jgi:hypothetical protein
MYTEGSSDRWADGWRDTAVDGSYDKRGWAAVAPQLDAHDKAGLDSTIAWADDAGARGNGRRRGGQRMGKGK